MNSQINAHDGPLTQELHLKMSKKIAQLTKVVYALNTKNDEHEAHVLCLQEAHELELKKVLSSTEDQITKLQVIMSHQRNDKEIIEELKKRIIEHDNNSSRELREFKDFKTHTHQRESELRRGYDEQMRYLKSELDSLSQDYRTKVQELTDRSSKNDVSSGLLNAMKEKHEKELELLKEVTDKQKQDSEKEKEDLKRDHQTEIVNLKLKHKEDLDAIVSSETTSLAVMYKAQISRLEEEVSTLKQVMEQTEYQSTNRLGLLQKELEEAEARLSSYNTQKEQLKAENANLHTEVNDLEEKFMEMRRDLDLALQRANIVEAELKTQRSDARIQAEDNQQKAGQIGMLDEMQHAHSVENQRLEFEVKKLRDKITEKEDEIRLVREKHTKILQIWEDKSNQLKKDITIKDEEIERIKAMYKLSLEEQNTATAEREADLHQQKLEEIRKLKEAHDRVLEESLEVSRSNMQAVREALEAEANNEKVTLIVSYEERIAELTTSRDELDVRVKALTTEVEGLHKTMSTSQSSLTETERERQELHAKIAEKQQYLELVHSELKDKMSILQSLRKEFDKEVAAHIETIQQREQYTADKVAANKLQLDEFWTAKLKDELNLLEHELLRRQSQSRNSEIRKIKDAHIHDFIEAEKMWKEQIESLQDKVLTLEKAINVLNVDALRKEMSLNEQSKSEYEELTSKLHHLKQEHAQHVAELEQQHREAIIRLEESLKRDSKNLEDKVVLSHRQSIHDITRANKLSVDALKDQLEQKRQMDLTSYKHIARKELEAQLVKCRKECDEETEVRLHELTLKYTEDQEELQRELEMRDREMKQLNIKMAQIQNTLTDKQVALSQYSEELEGLRDELRDMEAKYETKSKEVAQTKQEAVIQIKRREKKLNALHSSEMKSIQLKITRDLDELNFKHQNEIHTIRLEITELKSLLLVADERYDNRPSRTEDLARIAQLEHTLVKCDERITHLIDEKKFFELELRNRESNYNKVFNSSPKIGVMNPMVKTKIRKKKSDYGGVSAHTTTSFNSPNSRKAKLIPISSPTSSLESLVTHSISTHSSSQLPPPGPGRRIVKTAFLETADTVVPPT